MSRVRGVIALVGPECGQRSQDVVWQDSPNTLVAHKRGNKLKLECAPGGQTCCVVELKPGG